MKGTIFLSKKKIERTKIVYLKLQVRNSKSHIKKGRLISETSIYFCRNFKSEGLQ